MIGGNVTEKITPETYEKMNEEFEEEGLAFRIIIPTQEQIDDWREKMQAVIYSNGNLECERAKTLLEKLNFQIQEYKLNQHFSARGFVEEFGEEAEYPQVNVGFRHIGGLKDTLNYFKENNLL